MRFFLLILSFVLFSPAQVWAKPDLRKIQADLSAQQDKEREFAAQHDALEKKRDDLRDKLIAATREVQLHERALLKVQARKQKTQDDMAAAQAKLNDQRASLAQMVLALQRMNRLPPQAMLARPGAPIDTARSFYLLQHILPTLSQRAGEVKATLDELVVLQNDLVAQEDDLKQEQTQLAEKRSVLQKDLKARQALLQENEKGQAAAARKAASLAQQARDLRDLVARLKTTETSRSENKISQTLRGWFGNNHALPVEGKVALGYGDTMPGGGQSQGLSINAASGAIVTAPGDGVVRFAGPFRQYKLLVIIQHSNGEHSLLGGLQELYTQTGEKVTAGEPIGKLPTMQSGEKMEGDTQQASLYYERRRNGKPIDPRKAQS